MTLREEGYCGEVLKRERERERERGGGGWSRH